MTEPVVPTLSTAGYLDNPASNLEYLFRCFLATQASQSSIFKVHSFPELLSLYSNNETELASQCEDVLTSLYGSYYPMARVKVTSSNNPDDDSLAMLTFNVIVTTEEGTNYGLTKSISTKDGFKLIK